MMGDMLRSPVTVVVGIAGVLEVRFGVACPVHTDGQRMITKVRCEQVLSLLQQRLSCLRVSSDNLESRLKHAQGRLPLIVHGNPFGLGSTAITDVVQECNRHVYNLNLREQLLDDVDGVRALVAMRDADTSMNYVECVGSGDDGGKVTLYWAPIARLQVLAIERARRETETETETRLRDDLARIMRVAQERRVLEIASDRAMVSEVRQQLGDKEELILQLRQDLERARSENLRKITEALVAKSSDPVAASPSRTKTGFPRPVDRPTATLESDAVWLLGPGQQSYGPRAPTQASAALDFDQFASREAEVEVPADYGSSL